MKAVLVIAIFCLFIYFTLALIFKQKKEKRNEKLADTLIKKSDSLEPIDPNDF